MRKLRFVLALLALWTFPALAVPMTGSIQTSDGSLIGTGDWAIGSSLSWSVFQQGGGLWEYNYEFKVPDKNISHVIVQVSDNFTLNDIFAGTTAGGLLDTYSSTSHGNSNPGMPGEILGIKFSPGDDTTDYFVTTVSDREPMWGSFYAKDGKTDQGTVDVIAHNSGFGGTSSDPTDGTAPFGLALVPDTRSSIPEPGTVGFLLGGTLVLLARRRARSMPLI